MGEPVFKLALRGVRGTVPTPDRRRMGYGGNTACLDVALGAGHRLVLDCGSGLCRVPAPASDEAPRFDVLLTHYHVDHLIGLPFFGPLYDPGSRFTFYGGPAAGLNVREALESIVRPPWFPVALSETPSRKTYVELDDAPETFGGIKVTHARLDHPQGVAAFRLERGSRSVVLATDCERGAPDADARLARLARDTTVLIHDAQYLPEEYERHRGWGHSTWRHAVEAARECGARKLVLFHHDPCRTDDELDRIVEQARVEFPDVEAAREGMTFDL